ncbi:MAG: NAD(P)-dependent oxidoreductase [Caldilineaceae bacterium]|nr:NAD(P)-dependent oxidoreductase [Caldilineaceae bacterium]
MKVFVTGHRGRIGSEITRLLEADGHTVVGFDRADGQSVLDGAAVRAAAVGCEAAIHLASLLGGPNDDPEETMQVSVMGSWHVLQAAEAEKMQRVIYFSSVNALGIFMGLKTPDYLPIDDDYPPQPVSAYGLSKRLVEDMCRYFTERTGITTICLRPPWVSSPEAFERRAQWRAQNKNFDWKARWEYGAFCDVRDVARAAVLGLTCPDPGHVTILLCADQIGADRPSRELAQEVHHAVPWRGGPAYDQDPQRALVSNQRAKKILGWQPLYGWLGQKVEAEGKE